MRISGEQGKEGRNRRVRSRASAGGLTKVRADRTRLCAVSTRDLCRYTVPCQVAWFLWAPHALAACCNRHVRHALSWLCWLKTTAHNLAFVRHRRRGKTRRGSAEPGVPCWSRGEPSTDKLCYDSPAWSTLCGSVPLYGHQQPANPANIRIARQKSCDRGISGTMARKKGAILSYQGKDACSSMVRALRQNL